jgi:hypothetical protein
MPSQLRICSVQAAPTASLPGWPSGPVYQDCEGMTCFPGHFAQVSSNIGFLYCRIRQVPSSSIEPGHRDGDVDPRATVQRRTDL